MGDENQKEDVKPWDFLHSSDAEALFARIDYDLKGGKHLQRYKDQVELCRFIERNEKSLSLYYKHFFGVALENGGDGTEKYYYLDFMSENRGKIPQESRQFLANEHVLIGFLLFKIIYIDQHIELNSIQAFQKLVRNDYEDLKPGLQRALAKAKRDRTTELNDKKIDEAIENALKAFSKLGWIEIDGNSFEVLASFQRLAKVYADYINDIDSLLENKKVE